MDAFLAYGGRVSTTRAPQSPRTERPLAKRDRDRRVLAKLARSHARAEAAVLLARPEGPRLRALLGWLRTLSLDDADEFLAVLAGEDWLIGADDAFRRLAQRRIGRGIDALRRRAGLHPLDDPLPWDVDGRPVVSVHTAIKHILKLR